MKRLSLPLLLVFVLFLVACGGGAANPEPNAPSGGDTTAGGSSAPSGDPTSTPDLRNRPRTGTLKKNQGGGTGTVIITNQSGQDLAAFLMVDAETMAQAGYVRDGESLRMMGVKDGEYVVYVMSGINWDSGLMDFAEGNTYYQLAEGATVSADAKEVEVIVDSGAADAGEALTHDAYPVLR